MLPATAEERPEWLTWLVWLALLAGMAIYCRPALPPDETRYLSVAWEMWLRGDFLVPFKNGEPYSHKPPLLFWLIHAGWWAFGVNDWWPRLLSPLLSLASVWMTWRLARRLWPNDIALARIAPLVLLSSLLWALYSQALFFDVLITACALIGLNALAEAALTGRRIWWAVFGFSVGLGVLAKGPAILVHLLPAALLAPWWGRIPSRSQWYLGVLFGVLLGAGIALAWAIPAGLHGGKAYSDAIFWGQTANRMVESFAHRRPVWWYLAALPLFLFPWLVWPRLLSALFRTLRDNLEHAGVRFALVWFGTALLIFSAISGKQPHYLLPELPAAALLIGFALSDRTSSHLTQPGRPWLPGLVLLCVGVAITYLGIFGPGEGSNSPVLDRIPSWAGIGSLLAGWLVLRRADTPAAITRRLAWTMLASALWLLFAIVRPLAPAYDATPLARELFKLQAQGRPIAHVGKYHAQFQFNGRLTQALVIVPAHELADWLEQHPQGVAIIYFAAGQNPAPFQPLLTHPFRSGAHVLLDHRAAHTLRERPLSEPVESIGDTTLQ